MCLISLFIRYIVGGSRYSKGGIMDLPKYVDILKSQHFELNGCDCVILQRKHGLGEKSPLYIFNLSKCSYVSSLKELNQNTFYFDIGRGGEKYNLILDESKGIFNVVRV